MMTDYRLSYLCRIGRTFSDMTQLKRQPSNVYLAPAHLNHIRATINWQAMFEGLDLKKSKQKSKPNDWWALSPFNPEKTPSFHMGSGGIWYDFSSGQGGGPIELIQRLNNCNCYEAANFILEHGWAKSALLVREQQEETKIKVEKISQPIKNEPIRQNLLPMCTHHDYLAARGISEATCKALGIGYLPQGRSPLRGRVIFQIRDVRVSKKTGDLEPVILSHMGRAVKNDQKPKYLFYEGFHKSAELYGQDILMLDPEAQRQVQETGHIVLTEGPFDVAKAYEAGLRNVVASFGASLSESQVVSLKAMCEAHDVNSVLIAYDRDKTGINGSEKALVDIFEHGQNASAFNWNSTFSSRSGPVTFPQTIQDLAGFDVQQLNWLRQKSLI